MFSFVCLQEFKLSTKSKFKKNQTKIILHIIGNLFLKKLIAITLNLINIYPHEHAEFMAKSFSLGMRQKNIMF
jgi:hypothetical protein